jgi:ATP-dependent RNA helicase RhlE
MRAIEAAGYETPTPIQARAIPAVMRGGDVLGTAQTGTGKTAAFVLPILQLLLSQPAAGPGTRALVLAPTRELAEQINDVIRQLAKGTSLRSATVYGGVGMGPQKSALRAGVEIIVACPGRLLDHFAEGTPNFANLTHLVLDEADRMFDMGFLPDVRRIINRLPAQRQTLLFSATMPKEVRELAASVTQRAERIDIGVQKPASTVEHALYPVPHHLKVKLLVDLVKRTDAFSMLVFTRTKHKADRLARTLHNADIGAEPLHGDRSQNQRQRALDGFKKGKIQVLVATDIASRGLDIESVSHVINFDVPGTPEDYIHRIGRTGRAERTGEAFTLVTDEDRDQVRDIEKALGKSIERRELEGFDYRAPKTEQPGQQNPQPRGQRGSRPQSAARQERPQQSPKPQEPQQRPQSSHAPAKPSRPHASAPKTGQRRPLRSNRRPQPTR